MFCQRGSQAGQVVFAIGVSYNGLFVETFKFCGVLLDIKVIKSIHMLTQYFLNCFHNRRYSMNLDFIYKRINETIIFYIKYNELLKFILWCQK